MENLKGTKTEKNLMEAFAGESQVRNKYTYFASKAKEEGHDLVAAVFEATANNEKAHAEIWFKLLCGGEVPTTAGNLKAAAAGEHGEWTDMYKRMAVEAREEGFGNIALIFESVAEIEKEHEEHYLKLLQDIENSAAAGKAKTVWRCRNCGYHVSGTNPPQHCPVCSYPQDCFEPRALQENTE